MAKSKARWTVKMNQARELRNKGAQDLFTRIQLLCDIYNDEQFRDHCSDTNKTEEDYMDAELSDLQVDFLTVQAVFKRHTDVKDWQQHGFRYLLAETLKDQSQGREPRTVPSYKQLYEESQRKIEKLEAKIEALTAALRSTPQAVA